LCNEDRSNKINIKNSRTNKNTFNKISFPKIFYSVLYDLLHMKLTYHILNTVVGISQNNYNHFVLHRTHLISKRSSLWQSALHLLSEKLQHCSAILFLYYVLLMLFILRITYVIYITYYYIIMFISGIRCKVWTASGLLFFFYFYTMTFGYSAFIRNILILYLLNFLSNCLEGEKLGFDSRSSHLRLKNFSSNIPVYTKKSNSLLV